jgi:GNAT superfamily N-acetyltransferase
MQIRLLPELQRPLLAKFYRGHQSPMRAKGDAAIWVAREREIVGALCLTSVAGGQWLTGLFVAPEFRGQGVAQRLIEAAVNGVEGIVWLFCDPDLFGFYQRLGFVAAEQMPQALTDRLARYQQSKPLVAMALYPFVQCT